MKTISFSTTLVLLFVVFLSCPSVYASDPTYIENSMPAAFSEAALDKALKIIDDRDDAAFGAMLKSKQIFMLKTGLKVYVIDRKIWSGKIKIRPVGKTVEIWTVSAAIGE